MLDYAKLETEIAKTLVEVEKLRTERERLAAEREKLAAESTKLDRENKLGNFGVPAIATMIGATIVALLGALATVTVALLRASGH